MLCDLARLGFHTRDPKYRWVRDEFIVKRQFIGPNAEQVVLLSFFNRVPQWSDAEIEMLRSVAGSDELIMLAFSSTLRKLYLTRPELLTPIGRESALLQLVPKGQEAL